MFKTTIIAAAALVASTFAFQPGTAEAGSNVRVHVGLGVPYHSYGHRHHRRHRSYRRHRAPVYYGAPAYYGYYSYAPRPSYRRVSCRGAVNLLRDRGFHHIRATDCRGSRYGFRASRYGKRFYISISARNGRIIGKSRI